MTRLTTIAAAAVPLFLFAAPAAIQAAAPAPHFVAELAAPASEARAIAGGTVFACEGTVCTGGYSGHRPLRVCRQLQREVGTIASFSAGGEALSADDLARCNA